MIKQLNESTNLISLVMICLGLAFIALHQPDIAQNLVTGAIGIAGGGAIQRAATKQGDNPVPPIEPKPGA